MSSVTPSASNDFNKATAQLGEVEDVSWIRQSMLVPTRGLHIGRVSTQANYLNNNNGDARYASLFTYEALIFSDTTLGGNRAINPKHQFTFTADPKLPTLLTTVNHDKTTAGNSTRCLGMGRKYAESVERHASMITLQFGVPAYNSLGNFFSTFYSPEHSRMANDGVVKGITFSLGKVLGTIISWSIVPAFCAFNLLYTTSKKVYANLDRRPLSKFYYMKPSMALYWSTVTTISNALLVNMKLGAPADGTLSRDNQNGVVVDPSKSSVTVNDLQILAQILPDIWLNDKKAFDIRAVANRYARLANANDRKLIAIRERYATEEEAIRAIQEYVTNPNAIERLNEFTEARPMSLTDYLDSYIKSVAGQGVSLFLNNNSISNIDDINLKDKQTDNSADVSDIANNAAAGADSMTFKGENLWTGIYDHMTSMSDYMMAELRDGSAFVNFYVEWEQNVGESFSHNTKESAVAATMNSQSSQNRSKIFDLAGGNLGDNVAADFLESVSSAVVGLASGALDAIGFSGLAALGGRAFTDIPDFWDSGSVSFPTSTYSIRLRTPYGNAFSIYQDLMIPTSMLLAGVMCRAAGRNAYTGPFLCKLWQKGKTQIQLGLIRYMGLSRGQGNVGWNYAGQPTGIDINFEIINLSKMLYVPITPELSVSDLLGLTLFDEDTTFTDYMAVLGSLGLKDQYYASNRWRLKARSINRSFNSILNANNLLTNILGDSFIGSVMSIAVKQGHIGQP